MSLGRLLLAVAVLGAGLWILKSQHLVGPPAPEGERAAPIDRARAAARAEQARNGQAQAAAGALDSPASGGRAVGENMTPDDVRALLGPPDSVEPSTTQAGAAIEKWTYRGTGKTIVFENGVVARVE